MAVEPQKAYGATGTDRPGEAVGAAEPVTRPGDPVVVTPAATGHGGRLRRVVAGFLVVLFAVFLPVTAVVGWAHYTVLNTDGYMKAIGPIASDPAVTEAVSTQVTSQVYTALDVQSQIAGALPPRAGFLAGPITSATKGYVQSAVDKVLQSDQFQTIWTNANRVAHEQLVKVLRGQTEAIKTTNGQVVLDLVPVINAALAQIEPFVSGVVGKPVDLPTVSSGDIPAVACQKISTALDRPLPQTCGQIPLCPADKLTRAQNLVRAFDGITVALLVITPVLAAGALWASKRRRRTLLQLSTGGILGLVVVRRATGWLQDSLVSTGQPANKAARQAIVDHLMHGFFTLSAWLLVALAVPLVVTLVTGPYPWARRLRGWLGRVWEGVRRLAAATVEKGRADGTVTWVRAHLGALRLAGVVVAVVVMLAASVSFIGFLVVAGLLVLYELWLQRLGQTA